MEDIRSYLLQVVSAGLICGILLRLVGKKGMLGETVKLLAGVYMTLTVFSPWVNVSVGSMQNFTGDISVKAEEAAQEGMNSSKYAISKIIKERTQTYILDKAASLGASISVEVTLTEDAIPHPAAVTLTGQVSPYVRSVLAAYIHENIGIGLEDQKWIAQH